MPSLLLHPPFSFEREREREREYLLNYMHLYMSKQSKIKYIAEQNRSIQSPRTIFGMAISPESPADRNPIDFRAPPPSPIASGRRSSFANDDVLTEFLQHSLRVPDLILPDRTFPRQNPIQNPPRIDFQHLNSPENDAVAVILDSIARIGCFQVVNHGIARELVGAVSTAGAEVFGLPPEKKAAVVRSTERSYGFEESHGDEEREMGEEFVWGRDERLNLEMEGIWPLGYSNFR